MAMDVNGKLLPKRKLDKGLVLSTSEEGDRAARDQSDESEQRPEHCSILLAAGVEWEPESRARVGLSLHEGRGSGRAKTRTTSIGTNNGYAQAAFCRLVRSNRRRRPVAI